jgi:hypothetical protein
MGLGFNFWLFVAQAVAFSVFATWCDVDNRHSTMVWLKKRGTEDVQLLIHYA